MENKRNRLYLGESRPRETRTILFYGVNGEASTPLTLFYHLNEIAVECKEVSSIKELREELKRNSARINFVVVGESAKQCYFAGELAGYLQVKSILFGESRDYRRAQYCFTTSARDGKTLCNRIREMEHLPQDESLPLSLSRLDVEKDAMMIAPDLERTMDKLAAMRAISAADRPPQG